VPVRYISTPPDIQQIIDAKAESLNEALSRHSTKGWVWHVLNLPLLETRATAFQNFTEELDRISALPEPLKGLTYYGKREEVEYYYSEQDDWWAYYYVDEQLEAAVMLYIAHYKVSEENLAKELASRRSRHEHSRSFK